MSKVTIFLIFLYASVFLTKWNAMATSNGTVLEQDDDEADDEELEKMNFEQFKRTIKRYRRLIPYTSYYISNNHVNNQAQSPFSYVEEQILASQPSIINIDGQLNHKRQGDKLKNSYIHQTTSPVKRQKFIPSVQYDPRNIGGDSDYFTPVRYTNKVSYDGYHRDYKRRPSTYPEIPTPIVEENRYYTKPRSPQTVAYNPLYERDHQKQQTHNHPQYLVEYNSRPKHTQQPNLDYYPVDDFESLRYVKIQPPPPPPTTVYHQPSHVLPPIKRRPVYQQPNPIINEDNIAKSLQLTNQLPEILNKDNIDSSIKTLVEILSLLHSVKKPDIPQRLGPASTVIAPIPAVPQNIPSYEDFKGQYTQPKVVTETRYQATTTPIPPLVVDKLVRFKPSAAYSNSVKSKAPEYSDYPDSVDVKNHAVIQYYTPLVQDIDDAANAVTYPTVKEQNDVDASHQNSYEINEDVNEENEKTPIKTTEQSGKHYHLADGFINAALNIPNVSLKYGVTQGRPDTDYPIYASIPETEFNCKEQRYKGFFGDPSTRCQVWHYCDLNGGKSSFLCPNGTIFSQAALTCDWWFNVKCEATTQLYVLNERLYKFILPIMPKFPEDFSGPEVDQYLELKFKEMEAKLKAKKLKKAMEKKMKEKQQTDSEE